MFLSATVVSEKCDQLCFNAFKPLLVSGLETAKQSPKTEAHAIPQPLGKYMVTSPSVEEYQPAQLEPGWIDWQPSPLYRFLHVLKCQEPGPAMTVRFKGSLLGMEMVVGPDSGDVEVSIDGSPWQFKKASIENSDRDYVDLPVLLAEGLDPSAEHALKLRVAPKTPKGNKDKVVRISKLLVNGKIIFDDPWKGLTQLQRIDKIYAGLEPVKYQPPADRWKNIPKTMRTLNEGPNLTIVSLGDSLVNDTCSSSFQLLIERMYPKCKVKNVVSVRGGGGCQFYKIDNNVQEYVLRHKPDLLIIGGISNGGKDAKDAAENVREVIRQVKTALPDTEFLLMTGPFGLIQDPRQIENWKEFVTPDGTDPRSCLMKVAVEEKADFIDMHGIVGRYVLESRFPVRSFQRDHIHANWRGMQVLGRIIEKYFEPKKN
jgi:lysophospholipase L1-like esterase